MLWRELNSIEKRMCCFAVILFFHIIRNISFNIYATLFVAILFILSLGLYKSKGKIYFKNNSEVLFIVTLSVIPLITIATPISFEEYIIAIQRYCVIYVYVIFVLLYRKNLSNKFVEKILKIYVIFMFFSALSILYQIEFGAISFFAASSEREGLERFASLSGSLTVFGTAGAFGIVILLWEKKLFEYKQRMILFIFILLGLAATLQKAAIVNVLLVLFLYLIWYLNNKNNNYCRKILNLVFILLAIGGGFYVYENYFHGMEIINYVEKTIDYTFVTSDGQYSTSGDLLERLFNKAKVVIEFHDMSVINFIFGYGFLIIAGTFGLPEYPMCHNQFFEMLMSGGVIYLTAFLTMVYSYLIERRDAFTVVFVFLYIVNMLIGAASFYQPIIGVLFFTVVLLKRDKHE